MLNRQTFYVVQIRRLRRPIQFVVSMAALLGLSACVNQTAFETMQADLRQQRSDTQYLQDLVLKQSETLVQMSSTLQGNQQQVAQVQQTVGELLESHALADKKLIQKKKKRASAKLDIQIPQVADEPRAGKVILGYEEWLWIDAYGVSLRAELDTNRKTSILYVADLQNLERDGKTWARFKLTAPSVNGSNSEPRALSAPVKQLLSTKQDDKKKRYVVELRVKLGPLDEVAEFTLVERSSSHGVVLGRDFFQDIAVIDVSNKYTQKKLP